ncbi:hemicentin-1-like [Sycon ciliatum]|uniref:hemicentin-1-like n=1 Tax=Sycon ciliatum TaxID=27933 RepID=UPI0031F631E6
MTGLIPTEKRAGWTRWIAAILTLSILLGTTSSNSQTTDDGTSSLPSFPTVEDSTGSGGSTAPPTTQAPSIVKPTLISNETEFQLEEGSAAKLAFSFQSPAIPTITPGDITWVGPMGQLPLSSTSKYLFSVNRQNLTINNVTLKDAGNYTTRALNTAGTGSVTFSVDVYVVPVFSAPQPFQLLAVNETYPLIVACLSSSFPPASGFWRHETSSANIGSDGVNTVNTTTSFDNTTLLSTTKTVLTIPNVQRNLRGVYTCYASIQTKTMTIQRSVNITVVVYVKPKLISTQSNLTRLENETVPLSLYWLYVYPQISHILWVGPTGALPSYSTTKYIFAPGRAGVSITALNRRDAGTYTATASNAGGSGSTTFIVHVNVLPMISTPTIGQNVTVNETGTLIIPCSTYSYPQANVTWQDNGNQVVMPSGDISALTTSGYDNSSLLSITTSTLTIRNALYAYSGKYICTSTINVASGVHSATTSVSVTVQVGPTFDARMQPSLYVLEGSSFFVNCTAFANPEPTFAWQVNPTLYGITSLSSYRNVPYFTSLYMERSVQVRTADYKHNVTCTASNIVSTALFITHVTVNVMPKFVNSSGTPVVCNEHQHNVSLSCTFRGIERPTITWERTNVSLMSATIRNFTTTTAHTYSSVLTFAEVSRSDQGDYKCVGRNPNGTYSARLYLQVQIPARISSRMPVQNGVENTTLSLSVLVSHLGDPAVPLSSPLNVTWSKMNQSTWSGLSSFASLSPDRLNLTFNKIHYSDAGEYQACLINAAGSACTNFSILYEELPRIIRGPEDVLVNEIATVHFQCNTSGNPAPNITWYFNGTVLRSSSTVHMSDGPFSNMAILNRGSLGTWSHVTLFNVTNEQSQGRYQCVAKNIHSQANSSADLTIYVRPFQLSAPEDIKSSEGSVAQFICAMHGIPKPRITWYKDAVPLFPSWRLFLAADNGTLTIRSLRYGDVGHYQCYANNQDSARPDLGGATFSALAHLDIYVPPNITAAFANRIVYENSSLTLICGSYGNPTPSFSWFKNDLAISESMVQTGIMTNATSSKPASVRSQLLVKDISYWDQGTYTCVSTANSTSYTNASNYLDSVNSSSTLTVNVGPKFDARMQPYLYVLEGGFLVVNCTAFANPKPTFAWQVNPVLSGTTSYSSHESKPYFTSMYMESNVRVRNPYYKHNVTCTASNIVSTALAITHVTVNAVPKYVNSTSGNTVVCNEHQHNVSLSCTFRGIERPTISWTSLNFSPISGIVQNFTTTTAHTYSSVLTFAKVNRSDQGPYYCVGRNPNGTDSALLYLRVQSLPKIKAKHGDQTGKENSSLSLEVTIENIGDPPVPTSSQNNVTWSKNGNSTWNITARHFLSLDRLNLTFKRLHHSDTGTYTACLINPAGSACTDFTILYEALYH